LAAGGIMRALRRVVEAWPEFRRDFPWRGLKDPWRALLAELLLVQTDSAKALAAYTKVMEALPDPRSALRLGEGAIAELLRPLGLYRQRAKAIVKAAKFILEEFGGEVPRSYEGLKRVPGVGDYIAAAVAISACGEAAPAIDVNVARVLSRIALGRDAGKRYMYDRALRQLAEQISWTRELLFAVIDFAAQICTARSPKCHMCPARDSCRYFQSRGQAQAQA